MRARRRLTAALVALFVLAAVSARAQATFDATANGFCTAGSTCTVGATTLAYNITVGAGSNRAVAVFVAVACNAGQTAPAVSTLTLGAQSLTQVFHESGGAPYYLDLWSLPAGTQPTTGVGAVTVTLASSLGVACSGNAAIASGAISASGVDQTTTFSSSNGAASSTGTSASVIIGASGSNDLGVQMACAGSTLVSTTETSQWNGGDQNTQCNSFGGATAAGSDTSFSWSWSGSDSWAIVGAAFKAASGGAPACQPGKLSLMGVSQCG